MKYYCEIENKIFSQDESCPQEKESFAETLKLLRKNPICQKCEYFKKEIDFPINRNFIEVKYCSDPVRFIYFSQGTRDRFLKTLKNYDRKKVQKFISLVESDLSFAYQLLNEKQNIYLKFDLEKWIKYSEELLKIFKEISGNKKIIPPPRKCNIFSDNFLNDPWWQIIIHLKINADKMIEPLQDFIKNLKEAYKLETLSKGRPFADKFNLAYQIARRFQKYIEQPRQYSGPFSEIIDHCFNILGFKGSDRSRAIRQALKKLSQS